LGERLFIFIFGYLPAVKVEGWRCPVGGEDDDRGFHFACFSECFKDFVPIVESLIGGLIA